MPYPPMHCSLAYLTREFRPQLSLPALLVSTITPDLEIPLLYAATSGQFSRLILHSFLGAITLATLLSLILVVYAYSPTVSHLFKVNSKTVKDRCRFSWSLVMICLLGNISHVSIDALHHDYNPLFFPFTYGSIDALVFMNDRFLASVIVQTAFLFLLTFLVAKEVKKGTKDIWKRLLVE